MAVSGAEKNRGHSLSARYRQSNHAPRCQRKKVGRQARRKREKKEGENKALPFSQTPLFSFLHQFFFHSPSPIPPRPRQTLYTKKRQRNSPGFFLNNSAGPFSRHFVCKAFIENSTMRQLKKKAAAPRSRASQVGFFPLFDFPRLHTLSPSRSCHFPRSLGLASSANALSLILPTTTRPISQPRSKASRRLGGGNHITHPRLEPLTIHYKLPLHPFDEP